MFLSQALSNMTLLYTGITDERGYNEKRLWAEGLAWVSIPGGGGMGGYIPPPPPPQYLRWGDGLYYHPPQKKKKSWLNVIYQQNI